MDFEQDAQGHEMVARLLTALPDSPGSPENELPDTTGLSVPSADAAAVVDAARSVAARSGHHEGEALPELVRERLGRDRFSELCLVADALVIGEHPSVHTWSGQERRRATEWVAVLMDLLGEDGVQELIVLLTAQWDDDGKGLGKGPLPHRTG